MGQDCHRGAWWAQCWEGKGRTEPLPVHSLPVTPLPNTHPHLSLHRLFSPIMKGRGCHFLGDSSEAECKSAHGAGRSYRSRDAMGHRGPLSLSPPRVLFRAGDTREKDLQVREEKESRVLKSSSHLGRSQASCVTTNTGT